jgi:hypothetical protein
MKIQHIPESMATTTSHALFAIQSLEINFTFLTNQLNLLEISSVLQVIQFIKQMSAAIMLVVLELTQLSHLHQTTHKIVEIGFTMTTMTINRLAVVLFKLEIKIQIKIETIGTNKPHQTAQFDATVVNQQCDSCAEKKVQIRIDHSLSVRKELADSSNGTISLCLQAIEIILLEIHEVEATAEEGRQQQRLESAAFVSGPATTEKIVLINKN